MRPNFAHVLRIVTPVCTRSFEWIQWVLCLFSLERNSGHWLHSAKGYFFLTIGNNLRTEIHCCLCTAYKKEKVMILRNIHWWQSMFWEGRTFIQNKHKGQLSKTFDETVWCIYSLLKYNCCFAITQSRWGYNSSCIITALDAKVSALWVPRQLMEEHRKKNCIGVPLLPYLVQGGCEWPPWVNTTNYWRWRKLDPFLQARRKISEHGCGKKEVPR